MLHTGSLATYVTTGSLATYVTSGSIIPITAAGNNSNGGYTLLNPTNQYQLRALKGGNYISLAATNTDITIDGSQNLTNMFNSKQDKITVTGNDSINNFLLLDGALNLRSLQAGGYIQLVQNSTTLLITASSALQTALAGKQPSFTVSGDDVSSFRLLRSNYLTSIGSSDTVVPVMSTNPDGTPLMRFNCTLNVGSLTGYAPTASPVFSGCCELYRCFFYVWSYQIGWHH
jgi:hypothetical protein